MTRLCRSTGECTSNRQPLTVDLRHPDFVDALGKSDGKADLLPSIGPLVFGLDQPWSMSNINFVVVSPPSTAVLEAGSKHHARIHEALSLCGNWREGSSLDQVGHDRGFLGIELSAGGMGGSHLGPRPRAFNQREPVSITAWDLTDHAWRRSSRCWSSSCDQGVRAPEKVTGWT